jgi:hypothetical protein
MSLKITIKWKQLRGKALVGKSPVKIEELKPLQVVLGCLASRASSLSLELLPYLRSCYISPGSFAQIILLQTQ